MRIPTATYRLQLNRDFDFEAGHRAISYLDALGIGDVYSSPIYTARPGSGHGYDVSAHEHVNPELGGEHGFRKLANELRARDMGLLLDIVPNHMCVAVDANWRWRDVLENGPSAVSARFFDIDWRPPKQELAGRVLLPILPDQFGRVIVAQQLTVALAETGFAVRYGDRQLPLAPKSWPAILEPALALVRAKAGDLDDGVLELESIVRALDRLPTRVETGAERVRERQHEIPIIRARLATFHERSEDFRDALQVVLAKLHGESGTPASFDALAKLLVDQAYRLSSWRVAAHEINYRRFFDINDLAAIRVEDPVVFEAVHALPFRLAKEGLVTGLRIDHVDGLYDPRGYLRDVQEGWKSSVGGTDEAYVVVEKILGKGEQVPADWPTAGTTGYEFMNLATGVLIDRPRVARLHDTTQGMGGTTSSFADIVYGCKKLILDTTLVAELAMLARRLDRISEQDMFTRDFTRVSLQDALAEVIACFPVYRTYIGSTQSSVDAADRGVIERAVLDARRRNPLTPESVFDFIRSTLLLEEPTGQSLQASAERREFVMKFQQLTGPVMAKGVEDTAFYRYFPLAALEEVGGHPESMGVSLPQFHREMSVRAEKFPHALSATDTHDAKRSEDARARLSVLSEIPREWEETVARFRECNRAHKTTVGDTLAPDDDDEYLFYQTVLAIWPPGVDDPPADLAERVSAYMMKAVREAKRHSSWINPNVAYDGAVANFVAAALHPEKGRSFLAELATLRQRVERPGLWNSLTQTLLKVAAPGVPDFYQGSELWSFNLVDPDNRRPIDFDERRRIFASLMAAFEADPIRLVDELVANAEDGRIKMLVSSLALRLRRAEASLFRTGGYVPLQVSGQRAEQVVAFARASGSKTAVAICGRFFTRLGERAAMPVGEAWGDAITALPADLEGRELHDVFTGSKLTVRGDGAGHLRVAEVLAHLPVALVFTRS